MHFFKERNQRRGNTRKKEKPKKDNSYPEQNAGNKLQAILRKDD